MKIRGATIYRFRRLMATIQREVAPSEWPQAFDDLCRMNRLDPLVEPAAFEDQLDNMR